MQVRIKSSQTLTEPVTEAEFKTFSGYPGTDQTALITSLIQTARELFESETGLSCISKIYEAEFDRWDMIFDDLTTIGFSGVDDGWYRLPVSPVTAITTVTVGGIATTYSQRGLKIIDIMPDTIIQTGTTSNILAVTFTAGEASNTAKNAILRIALDFFNHRDDNTGNTVGSLSYDTKRLINSLSTNTGF
jgi:uncharacterized phiE125 gp8 family phage protein